MGFNSGFKGLMLSQYVQLPGDPRRGWLYFGFCVKRVVYVNSHTVLYAFSDHD